MNSAMRARTIPDLLAEVGGELTPVERRIAEAILAEPTLPAFGSVSDLAKRVGTSRPSIVRFAHKLGFSGYSELQAHVQGTLTGHLTRPSDRIRSEDSAVSPETRHKLQGALASVFEAVGGERLAELARPIAEARQVWVLSGETSKAGGHALTSGISMIREGVRFLGGGSLEPDLSSAGPGDTAVVFDFARYRRAVTTATRILASSGVRIVAITDSPLSPLVEHAERWCTIRVPAIGPFDSSVPVVAVAELLVARVAKELEDQATARIDRIEELWETTGRFE